MEQKDFLSLGELQEKQEESQQTSLKQWHLWSVVKYVHGANIFSSQNLGGDPVLLSSVEGFSVEHDVGTVAWLGAGDVTLSTQLHPRHSQNRPAQTHTGSGQWSRQ